MAARAAGCVFFFSTLSTVKGRPLDARFESFPRPPHYGISAFLPSIFPELGLEFGRNASGKQKAWKGQYSSATKASRSKFPLHNQPEGHRLDAACRNAALYGFPEQGKFCSLARRSSMRLACWASNRFSFSSRGWARASFTARSVISLNWIRFDIPGLIVDELCHMPGNGLSLAVRVGRKIDRGRAGGYAARRSLTTLRLFSITS